MPRDFTALPLGFLWLIYDVKSLVLRPGILIQNAPIMTKKNRKNTKSGNRPAQPTTAPLAVSINRRMNLPAVQRQKGDSFVVKHREYIADVTANGDVLNVVSFPLNPGVASTFPWLAHVASGFESYRFRELRVSYSPIAPATQAGTVMVAIDFDSADAAPITKGGMMAFQGSSAGPLWSGKVVDSMKSNLAKMVSSRYVRGGSLSANLDIKTYDVGTLVVGTANCGAWAGVCGELYVDYTVEFMTPQYNIVDEAADNSARVLSAGAVTLVTPLGSPVTSGNLPVSSGANGVVFQEPGDYIINLQAIGTAIVADPTFNVNGADVLVTVIRSVIDAAALFQMISLRVRCPRRGGAVYLDYTTKAATITATALRISKYLYSLA